MAQELKEIRYQSETYPRLTTLINRVNEESLKEAHRRQKTGKAVGVDGVTKEMYGENLDENVKDLVASKWQAEAVGYTCLRGQAGSMRDG